MRIVLPASEHLNRVYVYAGVTIVATESAFSTKHVMRGISQKMKIGNLRQFAAK